MPNHPTSEKAVAKNVISIHKQYYHKKIYILRMILIFLLQVVGWLLENGGRVTMDHLGGTPLHDAAQHGQIQVPRLVLFCMQYNP